MKADKRRAGRAIRRARQRQQQIMKLIPAYKKAFARFEQRMLPFGEYALPGLDAYRYRFGKGLAILHLHLPVGSLQDVVGDGDAIAMTQQRKDTAS